MKQDLDRKIALHPGQLSRLTVINEQGIEIEHYGITITDIQVQDSGRTLKIWYSK